MVYDRPAIEELIRWRLWDRTGAGLMAELGSHQLDAASIFIAAAPRRREAASAERGGRRPTGRCSRADRDVEDHVYCIIEFPAPGYDAEGPDGRPKKIGVQYASINGNGFGGYGEIVFGTEGTLVLEREQELQIVRDAKQAPSGVHVSAAAAGRRSTRRPAARRRPWPRRPAAGRNQPRLCRGSWSIGPGASAIRPPRTSPIAVPKWPWATPSSP